MYLESLLVVSTQMGYTNWQIFFCRFQMLLVKFLAFELVETSGLQWISSREFSWYSTEYKLRGK